MNRKISFEPLASDLVSASPFFHVSRIQNCYSMRWSIRSAVFAVFLLADSARPWAAEPEPVPPSAVVATVDGDPITAGELQRELDRAVKDRELAPAALQPVRDAALKQLIDRRWWPPT